MAVPTFLTKHVRPKERDMEVNSGEIIVETAGYVPADRRIKELIAAGERLIIHRSQFDYDGDVNIDDANIDPTRNPAFDLADASQLSQEVDRRLKESENAAKAAQEEENDVPPEEVSSETPPEEA
jgi:hypothetical protein